MFEKIFKKIKIMNSQNNIHNTQQNNGNNTSKNTKLQYNSPISKDCSINLNLIKSIFENCSDIIIREFKIGVNQQVAAFIVVVDALVSDQLISDNILRPLMIAPPDINVSNIFRYAKESAVSLNELKEVSTLEDVVNSIVNGNAALFIDGFDSVLELDVKSWEHRAIGEPETEATVRGSREGFVETLRTNTSLLRRILKNPNLKFEPIIIGKQSKTQICVAYIKGIVNEEILSEVRCRLKRIDTDAILESGYIEAFIEDAPFSVFPTVGNSEKPDKVSSKLLEGRIAILVEGTPFVLTVPYLFVESFQASEDYYSRPYYASALRFLRWISVFISINLPALYVAIVTYHHSLIPGDLLVSIAAALEGVPLPAAVEAILMQIIFEILREGGVRLPRPVGQAVSIVGALVIGEASVAAGFIGAPMVIIVALTAVSSFIVTSLTDVSFILRMALLVLAGTSGLYGVMLGTAIILTHLCSLRSIGVPYTASVAPSSSTAMKDVFIRAPLWSMYTRYSAVRAENNTRQGNANKPQLPEDNE